MGPSGSCVIDHNLDWRAARYDACIRRGTMKTATAISLSVLLVAPLAIAPLGGCAGDKNKQLNEATTQEAEAMRQAREEQIDQAKKQQEKQIEEAKKVEEQQIESAAKARSDVLPQSTQGTEEKAKAQADLVADRQKFQTEAEARLQKAEARLDESRKKLQVARGHAPTAVHDRLEATSRLANSLESDISHLSQVSNDAWDQEKKRIEARLDEIENAADDVKSKADDFAKKKK
jgi:hypothetical protein